MSQKIRVVVVDDHPMVLRGTCEMIEEAADSGYEALLLTVDAPYAGRRERDLRSGFQVPAEVRAPAIEAAVGRRSLTPAEVLALPPRPRGGDRQHRGPDRTALTGPVGHRWRFQSPLRPPLFATSSSDSIVTPRSRPLTMS